MSAWMVVKDGSQLEGQYTDAQVKELMQTHGGSNLMVWRAGMAQWADPKSLPEFQMAQPAPAAPAPTPAPQAAPAAAAPQAQPDPSLERMKQGGRELIGGAAEQLKKYQASGDSEGFMIHLKWVEKLLDMVRNTINRQRLDAIDEAAKKYGHLAFPVAAIVFVLFGMIAGGRMRSWQMAGMSLVIIPAAIIAHYIAFKFLNAGKSLIEKSPSKLSSKAFLDCWGLIAFVGAIGTLLGGVFALISNFGMEGLIFFAISLGVTAIMLYATGAALNSDSLNLQVSDEASAGQEAIGVFSFLMKMLLRLVPFVYGVGTIVGALASIGFLGWLVFAEYPDMVMMSGIQVLGYVFASAMLPFVTYLIFLLYYLSLDVLRAVLVVPSKLDRIADHLDK
ncbi:MAG: DUF4339 domain-containing protein [Acidobacteria bacterium]|nr:DUF4339 domain-containing protein [Acidobacteriota bacterium]